MDDYLSSDEGEPEEKVITFEDELKAEAKNNRAESAVTIKFTAKELELIEYQPNDEGETDPDAVKEQQEIQDEWLTDFCTDDQLPEGVTSDMLTEEESKVLSDTYLSYCCLHRPGYKKWNQVWNCYGNRANAFLIFNYGFAFADNKYNCYRIEIRRNGITDE